MALLLAVYYRRWRPWLAVMLPLTLAWVLFAAALGALDLPLNLYNLLAVPLVIGYGIDDHIFLVHRYEAEPALGAGGVLATTGRAIVLTSLSTMAGFAGLAVARFDGLRLLGLSGALAVLLCLLAAFAVLPGAADAAHRLARFDALAGLACATAGRTHTCPASLRQSSPAARPVLDSAPCRSRLRNSRRGAGVRAPSLLVASAFRTRLDGWAESADTEERWTLVKSGRIERVGTGGGLEGARRAPARHQRARLEEHAAVGGDCDGFTRRQGPHARCGRGVCAAHIPLFRTFREATARRRRSRRLIARRASARATGGGPATATASARA